MKETQRTKQRMGSIAIVLSLFLTGCGTIGLAQESAFESAYQNTDEETTENPYSSETSGVFLGHDEETGEMRIYRTSQEDELTLTYSGATSVLDQYGSPLTLAQLQPGELVQVAYNSEFGKAGSIAVLADAFRYSDQSKHDINEGNGTLSTGSETLHIDSNTKVFSGSEEITLNQILPQDIITIRGNDRDVVSIVVESGHGYLKLENDEALLGGWIEVGQTVIQQISEGMLITVPEGAYNVRLTVGNVEENREVTIVRGEETLLDLSDIEVPQPVSGLVSFSISPSGAAVYVDGVSVDASYTIKLPFGLHQIAASADGYDTVSEYFEVEGENTRVKLSLTPAAETVSVSGNETEDDTDGSYTITVQAPEDVEVYQDNLYMGIAPVMFTKTIGSHTISLRKSGYMTQSYQIEVEDDDKDLVYAFPDLVASGSSATVSGNSSGNSQNSKTVSGNSNTVSGNSSSTS